MSNTQRQLKIELPDLTQSDLIDITRVLQAFTDAFIAHHQQLIQRQQQAELQTCLFEFIDDEDNPVF